MIDQIKLAAHHALRQEAPGLDIRIHKESIGIYSGHNYISSIDFEEDRVVIWPVRDYGNEAIVHVYYTDPKFVEKLLAVSLCAAPGP